MTLYYKYYLEIKNRLLLILFSWISVLVTCYYFKEPLLFVFINLNKYYNNSEYMPYFIFTDISEIFHTHLQLIFFIANQVFVLMSIYQTLIFLTLGLYNFEYAQLRSLFQVFLIAWFCSILLLKEIILPFSWSFFLGFQETNNDLTPMSFFFEAKIIDYIDYFITLYYVCFLNTQALVILTFGLNIISEKSGTVKTFRKLFYFVFVVFSTLTTPPDITSQIIVSLVLILIYELSIFFRCLIKLKKEAS